MGLEPAPPSVASRADMNYSPFIIFKKYSLLILLQLIALI
ncbi:hypothetical protein SOHN41_02097 [Shewanella sp. HN-41]|nr:hypothetical protein SOHN41_02097 [Shewanella sp. HN-41]